MVIGFAQQVYSVTEDIGEVMLFVGVISGDVRRPSSVFVSTASGMALGNALPNYAWPSNILIEFFQSV